MSKAVSCRRSLEKQADTVKGITEQAGRDCKAYELARDYLLELPGVTDKVLQRYLSPPRSDTPSTMAEVFLRLLLSLRNKNMMATVIPAKFVHSLGRVLNSFDPVATTPALHLGRRPTDGAAEAFPGATLPAVVTLMAQHVFAAFVVVWMRTLRGFEVH